MTLEVRVGAEGRVFVSTQITHSSHRPSADVADFLGRWEQHDDDDGRAWGTLGSSC